MAKCTNCGSEWTFKDKMKKSAAFSQAMSCPYCGADQFFSPESRKRSVWITFTMILAFFIPTFFDTPWQVHIPIIIIALILSITFQIHAVELHDKEEYPF